MVVIPKEKPLIAKLNSYYVNIPKMIEHYQGQISSGGAHFKSHQSEGVIYFDKDEILNSLFESKEGRFSGDDAVQTIIDNAKTHNFEINVFEITIEGLYFWASILNAQRIYEDLSTEFTDLEGLIKKMRTEKLTGYIDAEIGGGAESGLIFFNSGSIIGGSFSWGDGNTSKSKENYAQLIKRTKRQGGIFHVNRIITTEPGARKTSSQMPIAEPAEQESVIPILGNYLKTLQDTAASHRVSEDNFLVLLKKKFIEKAEKFMFLDPFAAEFEYAQGKVNFYGDATDQELLTAIMECANEIANENNWSSFTGQISRWLQENEKLLNQLGMP